LLKGLDDWHATLVGLDDVHDGVPHKVWLFLSHDIAFHGDLLLVVLSVVLGGVVVH